MDLSPGAVTFADLLTPAGMALAGGAVMTTVELIKAALPTIDRRVSGATLSFVLAAILYLLVGASIAPPTLDGYLPVFFAFLTVASAAIGVKAGIAHGRAVSGGYAGIGTVVQPVSHTDAEAGVLPAEEDLPPL